MTSQTKGHADPEHSTPKPINPENMGVMQRLILTISGKNPNSSLNKFVKISQN